MSEDNVVSIFNGDKTKAEADAELISGLEDILTQARAGTLTGIAFAAGTSDGGIITGIHRTVASNAFSLLGAVTHLFQRANKQIADAHP